jgi:tRNA (uracil-5-)-methyltransferase
MIKRDRFKTHRMIRLSYKEQLSTKQQQLQETILAFYNELKDSIIKENQTPLAWMKEENAIRFEEMIPSPIQEGYRSKCEFTIGKSLEGEPTVGFLLGLYRDGQISVLVSIHQSILKLIYLCIYRMLNSVYMSIQ